MQSQRNGKLNFLERAISYVAPSWAAKRVHARLQMDTIGKAKAVLDSAYDAGSYSDPAFQEYYVPENEHPEKEYNQTVQNTVVGRCRDSYKNNCVAKSVVDRLREHAIGSLGLQLQSRIDGEALGLDRKQTKALNKQLERRFYAVASSYETDFERSNNFFEAQDILLCNVLICGDAFANTPFLERPGALCALKFQLIDSRRVGNPSGSLDTKDLRKGIYFNATTGEPTHIYVYDNDPLISNTYLGKKHKVFGELTGRRRIFHVLEKDIDLSRGIPLLANILKVLKQTGRYIDSELVAAVISSYFTVFLKKTSGTGGEYDLPIGETNEYENSNGQTYKQIKLGPGMVNVLDEDVSPEFANPARPNPNSKDFLYLLFTLIGASTGVPVELFLMNFQQSFWAARASLNAFWKRVGKYRTMVANRFCRPFYELWLDEEIAAGRFVVPNGKRYSDPWIRAAFQSDWEGSCRDSINENQQALGAKARVDMRISTRQNESQQITGLDFDDVLDQLEYEEKEISRRGLSIVTPQSAQIAPAQSEEVPSE